MDRKEREVWRLEPEGEAEKPGATGLWSGAKGVSVNLEGESRLWHARVKWQGRRENQTKMEEKVNGKALSDEGAEVQSPRRNAIRVESEETQDM